ncbi:MAG TPA: diacylglycerol kinase family protein [Planctomycetota bacterium]|nr:diacylglycerol kinase family protein [Planctomycetota bacterium]
MRRVELVFNPISGRGRSAAAAETVAARPRAAGVETRVRPTGAAGDARRFAADLAPDADALIAVGGDGTLNEIVSGLTRDVPVGLVPVGTANVVARDLRLPFAPAKAADVVLRGRARTIDVGAIGDRRFVAMVGVGFDGEIVRAIAAARRGPITPLAYVRPALRTLRGFAPKPLRLVVDGAPVQEDVFGVIVSNTRCYGGYFSVTPKASVDDGLLHYVAWRRGTRASLLRYAWSGALRSESGAALYGDGRRFTVESKDGTPVAVQADGDPWGVTPLEARVVPGALRMFAPEGASR